MSNYMNQPHVEQNQQTVIACLDGSSHSQAVCDYAIWVSKQLDAPLDLLHTIEHQHTPPVRDLSGAIGLGASEDLLHELLKIEESRSRLRVKKGNLMLKAAQEKAQQESINKIKICLEHGTLNESLIEKEQQTRILVMGLKGETHENLENEDIDKVSKKILGVRLESVVRALHKPILVVNDSFRKPQNIMLAYNGSDESKKALNMIASSPLFLDMNCHVVHVTGNEQSAESDQFLNEAKETLSHSNLKLHYAHITSSDTKNGGTKNSNTENGDTKNSNAEDALINYQSQNAIDLMLMGAFSHNRVRNFLLGSFTASMLKKTKTPLLLLR